MDGRNANRPCPRTALLAVAASLLLAATALPARERVVLLPEEDGTTGAIRVQVGDDSELLTEPHSAVRIYYRYLGAFLDEQVDQAELNEIFGKVLGVEIKPDNPLDTLPEIIDLTLATHPSITTLAHEHDARSWYATEALSGYLPRINIVGGAGREWTRSPVTRANRRAVGLPDNRYVELNRREVRVDLRQHLFNGWETITEYRRRAAEADAASYQLQARAEELSSRVADTYLDLLYDNDLLELALEYRDRHESLRELVVERTDAGVGSASELDQANARASRAQNQVVSAETTLKDSLVAYLAIIGYPPPEALTRPEADPADLPASLEEALAFATDHHPSILATEADIAAAKQQIQNARSLFWPRIELQLTARYGDDLDGIRGFDHDVIALINFKYNFANGGADRAKIRRSAAVLERARDLRASTEREVTEAVRQAWNAYHSLDRRVAFLERQVAATARARDAYREQYEIGERTLLDLLDSERELYESRRTLLDSRRDRLTALFRLRASMGTLVDYAKPTLPGEAKPAFEAEYAL